MTDARTKSARRGGLAALLAGLALGSVAMMADPAPAVPIHLACTAATDVSVLRRDAACAAMAETLRRLAPARPVRQESVAAEGLSVTLHVTRDLPRQVDAVLRWHDGGRGGESPEIAVRVVDSGLSQEIYRAWAEQLIAAAELPL